MDLKQLRYFARIADVGNMTRAAESLHIAQPALTQQVANLEAELGVRVFDRGRHGVRLTSAGEVLYGYATSLLKQAEDAREAVRDETQHPSGRVVVGIPGSTGKLVAVPLLRRLASRMTGSGWRSWSARAPSCWRSSPAAAWTSQSWSMRPPAVARRSRPCCSRSSTSSSPAERPGRRPR